MIDHNLIPLQAVKEAVAKTRASRKNAVESSAPLGSKKSKRGDDAMEHIRPSNKVISKASKKVPLSAEERRQRTERNKRLESEFLEKQFRKSFVTDASIASHQLRQSARTRLASQVSSITSIGARPSVKDIEKANLRYQEALDKACNLIKSSPAVLRLSAKLRGNMQSLASTLPANGKQPRSKFAGGDEDDDNEDEAYLVGV